MRTHARPSQGPTTGGEVLSVRYWFGTTRLQYIGHSRTVVRWSYKGTLHVRTYYSERSWDRGSILCLRSCSRTAPPPQARHRRKYSPAQMALPRVSPARRCETTACCTTSIQRRVSFPTRDSESDVLRHWVPATQGCRVADDCFCFHVQGHMSRSLDPDGWRRCLTNGWGIRWS